MLTAAVTFKSFVNNCQACLSMDKYFDGWRVISSRWDRGSVVDHWAGAGVTAMFLPTLRIFGDNIRKNLLTRLRWMGWPRPAKASDKKVLGPANYFLSPPPCQNLAIVCTCCKSPTWSLSQNHSRMHFLIGEVPLFFRWQQKVYSKSSSIGFILFWQHCWSKMQNMIKDRVQCNMQNKS